MKEFIVVLLVAALFFAGCGGSPPAQNGGGQAGAGTQGGGQNASTTGGAVTGQQNASTAGGAGGGQVTPPSGGGQQTQGLSGLGYAQLVALGLPVRCAVTMTTQGQTVSSTLWILGNSMRAESTVPGQGAYVSVQKNNVMYFELSGALQQAYAAAGASNCKWLKIEPQETQSAGSPSSSVEQIEQAPSTSFNCVADVFGNEKFDTPGNVCSYSAIMGAAGGAAGGAGGAGAIQQCLSACAMIPADQQQNCQQACATAG